MKTLDDIISSVQAYALKQDAPAAVYKIEQPNLQYELLWLPNSFRELISINSPSLFIFFCYQAILGRAPDQEGAHYYQDLLISGQISLRKFALQILSSTESTHSNHKIRINKIDRYLIAFENKILSRWGGRRGAGLIGRLHDLLLKLSSYFSKETMQQAAFSKQSYDLEIKQEKILLALQNQQNNLSGQVAICSNDIRAHATQISEQTKLELSTYLETKITHIEKLLESNTEKMSNIQQENSIMISNAIEKNIDMINKSLDKQEIKIASLTNRNQLNNNTLLYLNEKILNHLENGTPFENISTQNYTAPTTLADIDSYYLAFEAKFRGPEEEIKAKLEKYTPYVETFLKSSQAPLLDIGMGRGEWLKLITEKGLKAQGVDQSEEMIQHCRAMGLSVVHADALKYLNDLPDQSFAAISSFHVVEHLPFDILFNMLKQAYRTLLPGGILILETPNPENVLVGSHTFYHDFSHKNPVTPTSLQFLVEYHGFKNCEILRLNPYPESAKVPGNDLLTERVNGHLCGPQDYALIARR
jgi:SAM-dependent methyltransferase